MSIPNSVGDINISLKDIYDRINHANGHELVNKNASNGPYRFSDLRGYRFTDNTAVLTFLIYLDTS